jgi:hypothetical protein
MDTLVYVTFGVAAAAAAVMHLQTRSAASDKPRNGDLSALQRRFFAAYFPALLADWLQGEHKRFKLRIR